MEKKKIKKVRFQMDLRKEQADIFDALVDECGLSSRKELFNTAMTLFNWAVEQAKDGKKVATYDADIDEVKTVMMPALENIINIEKKKLATTDNSKF